MSNSLAARNEGCLDIDDTVVKKIGKKTADRGWHYCNSEGNVCRRANTLTGRFRTRNSAKTNCFFFPFDNL